MKICALLPLILAAAPVSAVFDDFDFEMDPKEKLQNNNVMDMNHHHLRHDRDLLAVTLTNIALNKPTEQSSLGWRGLSEYAVDGNTDGYYFSYSSSHTAEPASKHPIPWWKVTFGGADDLYQVYDVIIWNRTDCCIRRLDDAIIMLLDANGNTLQSINGPSNWAAISQDWTTSFGGAVGAALKISLSDNNAPLTLAEVQVYGHPMIEKSLSPSSEPSSIPTRAPSKNPSSDPTTSPSSTPTESPTYLPSITPSDVPTISPSSFPSEAPSEPPSVTPTNSITTIPSVVPSEKPMTLKVPSEAPKTLPPSVSPTSVDLETKEVTVVISINGVTGEAMSIETQIALESTVQQFLSEKLAESGTSVASVEFLSMNRRLEFEYSNESFIISQKTRHLQVNSITVTLKIILQAPINLIGEDIVNDAISTGSDKLVESLSESGSEFFANTTGASVASKTPTPTNAPIDTISAPPSAPPSKNPSVLPTLVKSFLPSSEPSTVPSMNFSQHPSAVPTLSFLTKSPSKSPSFIQTSQPTVYSTLNEPIFSGSSNDPSKSPIVHPSSKPSYTPSISFKPSTLPSLAPTQVPSVAPSRSEPVFGSYSLLSTLEKPIYDNLTWVARRNHYDLKLSEYMTGSLGNCTIELCESRSLRRLDDQVAFEVIGVDSQPSIEATCVPSSNITTCQQVNTVVSFLHYEPLYSFERSKLIVVRESVKFIDENPEDVLYDGPRTKTVTSGLSLTIEGVEPEEMDEVEAEILVDSITSFLHDVLAQADPPIDIINVEFDSQTLQLDISASDRRRNNRRRYLQEEQSQSSIINNSSSSSSVESVTVIASITVNISITGEYLPPPEVDFTMVVVDTFDDEGDSFVEIVDAKSLEKNITYFKNVTNTKVTAILVMDQNKSSGVSAPFGGLGSEAGIALIAIGVLFIVFPGLLMSYSSLKKRRRGRHTGGISRFEEKYGEDVNMEEVQSVEDKESSLDEENGNR